MPFNVFDLILSLARGVMIGIVVSAPMGPIGVLTVQRTLNKGRWYGFVTGMGASLSDLLYALITGFGISFVMDFINKPSSLLYLKLIGGLMLFGFGLYLYRSKPAYTHKPSGKRGSLTKNFMTGFLVTFSNPLIVFLFMALMARTGFVEPYMPIHQGLGYIGIILGALAWWLVLTAALTRLRGNSTFRSLKRLNNFMGAIVMVTSVIGIIYTISVQLCS